MAPDPKSLAIAKRLSVHEVAWPQVLDRMTTLFKLPFLKADSWLRIFLAKVRRPFGLYWFLSTKLSRRNNLIIACACQVHGADSLELWCERTLRFGPLTVRYLQTQHYQPLIPRGEELGAGTVTTEIMLDVFGLPIRVRTFLGCLALQILFFTLAVFLYVLAAGVFLYSLSVFLLFVQDKAAVTRSALNDPKIGLALLGFLVVIAAIGGRALSNLGRIGIKRLRRVLE